MLWVFFRQEKGTQTLTFLVRIFPDGVGVFHVKGWGPKSSVCPSKPGKSNFFGGISRNFAWDIPAAPEKFEKKKVCVQFLAPNFSEKTVFCETWVRGTYAGTVFQTTYSRDCFQGQEFGGLCSKIVVDDLQQRLSCVCLHFGDRMLVRATHRKEAKNRQGHFHPLESTSAVYKVSVSQEGKAPRTLSPP